MPMSERAIIAENKMMRRIQDEIVLCLLSLLAAIIGDAIYSRSPEMRISVCELSIVVKTGLCMPANEKTATNCKVKKPKTCLNT